MKLSCSVQHLVELVLDGLVSLSSSSNPRLAVSELPLSRSVLDTGKTKMTGQGLTHSHISASLTPCRPLHDPQGIIQHLNAIVVMGREVCVGALAPRPEEIGLARPLETKG